MATREHAHYLVEMLNDVSCYPAVFWLGSTFSPYVPAKTKVCASIHGADVNYVLLAHVNDPCEISVPPGYCVKFSSLFIM